MNRYLHSIILSTALMYCSWARADGCGWTAAPMVLPAGMGIDDITIFRGRDEVSLLSARIWFQYRPDSSPYGGDWGYTPSDRSTIHPALNFTGNQSAYSSGIRGESVIVDVGGRWGTGQGGFRDMPRADIKMSESTGTVTALFYTSCTDPYPNTTVTVFFSCHICNQVNIAPQPKHTFTFDPSLPHEFHFTYSNKSRVIQRVGVGDQWNEFNDGVFAYSFRETRRDASFIYIYDQFRDLSVALPINGGISWITNVGKWQKFLPMTPLRS